MKTEMDTEIVSISRYLPLPRNEAQYSFEFMEHNGAIVLKTDEKTVTVGLCEGSDPEIKKLLSHFHEKRIRYKQIERDEFSEYLARLNADLEDGELDGEIPSVSGSREKLLLDKITGDAPVINFVNSTIMEAIRRGASDIHIEAFTDLVRIRYRIDGMLRTHDEIPLSMFPAVSSRLKIMANLNIMERRLPQDGRTSVHIGKYTQDIRISVVPTVRGESIVLRLLNRKNARIDLDRLGLAEKSLVDMRNLLTIPFGLVIVSGPTGSGKTTTLHALLKEMDNERRKIITVEDPVEYVIDGIDQIQTNDTIGLTFSTILRRILRQDPDVIMIGEIRDRETASLAVRAALTGHLVLSTLHTQDSISVVDRLHDMGVEPFMTAAVLKISMAQRLVRTVCPYCTKKRKLQTTEKQFFSKTESTPEYLSFGAGCERCNGTGYLGRTIIHEYFFTGRKIERLIAADAGRVELERYVKETGFISMFEDGLEKVKKGQTTVLELKTVTAVQ